jgi:ligand-binding sensor domain-containing protein
MGQGLIMNVTRLYMLLADLGLERSRYAERGLALWAVLASVFAFLTLWMATRRGGLFRKPTVPIGADRSSSRGGARGWPFMKQTLLGVAQLLTGVLTIYAVGRMIEPSPQRPAGWFLMSPPHEVRVLARQGDVIWAGGQEGLFAFERQTLQPIVETVLQTKDLRDVRGLWSVGETLWIGCRAGLFKYEFHRLVQVVPPGIDDLGPVTAMCGAKDDTFWVGAGSTLWRLEQGKWARFGPREGLVLPSVDVIYKTSSGALWVGSNKPEARAVFRFEPVQGRFLSDGAGLRSFAVNDLLEDRSGVLWAGTGFGIRGSAAQRVNGHWEELPEIPGIHGQKVRSLFEDSQQRLWFCSEFDGVALRNGNRWRHITLKDGLPGAEVKDVLADQAGTLWLATERGLGCLRNGIGDGPMATSPSP